MFKVRFSSMKKQYLLINVVLLFSLVACSSNAQPKSSEVPDDKLLTIHDDNAKLIISGYGKDVNGDDEWYPLATYYHKDNGEAPYVELNQLFVILNEIFHNDINYETMTATRLEQYDSSIQKISNHFYGIYSEGVLGAVLDTKENILNIKRYDYMLSQPDSFNGIVRNDVASPKTSKISLVHGSIYSKYLGTFKEEVYDLDDYGMDIIEMNDKVYMPAQLLSSIFFRSTGTDFAYNGNDFFLSSNVGTDSEYPSQEGSFRSGNDSFEIGGTLYTHEDPIGEEECRYVGKGDEEASYAIFSLNKDGSGFAFNAATPDAASSEDTVYKLSWERKEGDMYVTFFTKNPLGEFASTGHTMRISSKETFFNKKERSKALSEFNYQLLRFQIDNFYGLKPELSERYGFKDFDSFVAEKGLKDKLLSTDSRVYDEGLSEFLVKYIDDGHTKYSDRSIFSGHEAESSGDLSTRYVGERRTGLLNKRNEYIALRKETLEEGAQEVGLFMEDETAVIRFDSFMHLLPIISDPGSSTDSFDIPSLMGLSTPFGFVKSFKAIEENSNIKNVVLDLTCNGGGMVLTLPFLAAFFTKDPILYLRDNLSSVVREFHYDVDLNMDGIYRGEGDYFGDKYHFYVLTSDFSFSCGSALPTMAHIAGIDIIGTKCGGGACNVAGFCDACGSIYTLSAPQQIGYLDEEGNFINDDAGIPVTHELAKDSWYDLAKLNQAVKGFSAQ